MATTIFVAEETRILAAWLNDVNNLVYDNIINVKNSTYGATGNGSTDDTSSIQAAINAAVTAGGGRIFFPPGQYNISASLIIAGSSVYLEGAGANASAIAVTANSVNAISVSGAYARIGVKGLWIGSFAARTGCIGIKIAGASSGSPASEILLRDVNIQNLNAGIDFDYVHQSNVDNVRVIQSIASAVSSVGMHLKETISCNFANMVFLATTGTFGNDNIRVDRDSDSVVLQNISIYGGTTGYGIRFRNSGGTTGPRLTRALNCYSELCSSAGFYVEAGRDIRLIGCHAAGNGTNGYLLGGDSTILNSCLALQNNQHGIWVSGGTGIGITDCTCSDNSQTTDNTYDGIRVEDNVTHVRINGCRSGDFIFSLTNDQRYGLSIGATGTDYIVASGNDFQGNQTGTVGNFSSGTNNDLAYDGSFTATGTGCTTSPANSWLFSREGRIVTVYAAIISGTSNMTSYTVTGFPVEVRPTRAQEFQVRITDNGTPAFGWASLSTTGVLTLAPTVANSTTGWTNSGTKAFNVQTMSYSLS